MEKINWTLFEGSSHCEEGLGFFVLGIIKTFDEFEKWFLPHMREQAAEVRKMKGRGIKKMRQSSARAFKRFCGNTPVEEACRG